MLTQLEQAKKGIISEQMQRVSVQEHIASAQLCQAVAKGEVVIPVNKKRIAMAKVCGIGKGLTIKVNANIGTSQDNAVLENELEKIKVCIEAGADTVMDLSTGGDIQGLRQTILKESPLPVGTVPLYQSTVQIFAQGKKIEDMTAEDMINAFQMQAEEGVDFMTIHCGITRRSLEIIARTKRVMGVVSRGGALLVHWMRKTGQENPYYACFDRIVEIAREHDVTLSLGDGLRPGSTLDASDELQIDELKMLAQLAKQAHHAGVGVMIEGPGHVPLDQIQYNVHIQKQICGEIPFYVLGPLVTDCGAGYDHITAAIGGTLAGYYGANFLCYVTSAEHIGLPTIQEVKEGIVAFKIAAHAADVALKVPSAIEKEKAMSIARYARDWQRQKQCCFDPQRFEQIHTRTKTKKGDVCSMCSDFCSLKIFQEA